MQHNRVKDQTYSPFQESSFEALQMRTELEVLQVVTRVKKHPEGTSKDPSAKMKDLITKLTNRSKRRLKLHQGKRETRHGGGDIREQRPDAALEVLGAWAREGTQRLH